MLVIALGACATHDAFSVRLLPDASPTPADAAPLTCAELAEDAGECCHLFCTDPAAFDAQCAPPAGSCIDFGCPLLDPLTGDKSFLRPGICTPAAGDAGLPDVTA